MTTVPDPSAGSDEPPIEGIAIVGMAGRFPGAANPAELWRRLCAGDSMVAPLAAEALEDIFTDEERAQPEYVAVRPVLENVELFDAALFGMRPREAALTDPQHRVFLEVAWEAFEDAGYPPLAPGRPVGVYAGCSLNTYLLHHVLGEAGAAERFTSEFQVGNYEALTGAIADALATRVSYKLDLRGPSMSIATACSTSLTAVAQAVQALLLHQCDMALAGGVSISLPQRRGYISQEGGIVSTDGVCRPFDADANGTVFGAGAAAVLLKRVEDAVADGDHIYAVIRGASVNNDGASKVGFAAPSVDTQAEVIATAHAIAGIDPETIGYVECHGTATPLGDPIEIAALAKAFGPIAVAERCLIGSVKGNVGHLDAAAGVTGLIKAALAVESGTIPATANFRTPNSLLDLASTPFAVASRLAPWPARRGPRRAGVSALGVGGTNVHVVLEEAPRVTRAAPIRPAASVIPLSARTGAALDAAISSLAEHLEATPTLDVADVAHTLQVGRTAFQHRAAIVCRDLPGAIAGLRGKLPRREVGGPTSVVFMFPGQGSQHIGMGRDLYRGEAVYRDAIDRGLDLLDSASRADVRAFLDGDRPDETTGGPAPTGVAQPAIFLTQHALAALWMSWGIRPAAMVGHSVGELTAACLAGVLTFEDALAFVVERGRLMQSEPGGAMLAVRLPEAELRARLPAGLDIAAVNAPNLCVAAGSFDAVAELESGLLAAEVSARRLHTSHAFHSRMMDPVVDGLAKLAERITLNAPNRPYASSVSGGWITPEQATSAHYWARHCRETVRFADALRTVAQDGSVLLEVGPGRTLSTFAHAGLPRGTARAVINSMPDPAQVADGRIVAAEALAELWTAGVTPDWEAVGRPGCRRLSLPTYRFDRQRHWIDAPARIAPPAAAPVDQTGDPRPNDPFIRPSTNNDEAQTTMGQTSDHGSVAARTELVSELIAMVEELSGVSIDADHLDSTFLEHGLDSLFLAQFVTRLRKQYGVKLTFRQLSSDLPSMAALADHIAAIRVKAPAAPGIAVAAEPSVAVPMPAPVPSPIAVPALLGPAAAIPADGALHSLLHAQLQTLQSLLSQQCGLLGTAPAAMPATAPAQAVFARPAPAMPAAVAANAGAAPIAKPATPSAAAAVPTSADEAPARIRLYRPGANAVGAITPRQQTFIDDLVARYNARTPLSKARAQAYRSVLADPRSATGFRQEWKDIVYPVVCERSKGSHIWDIDGNDYVDLVNGFGQTAFGHSPDFVTEALVAQLERGFAIGPQSPLAGETAALFAEITGNERVTFCNTGSEAVMAAMRVARTVTGRDKVVIFTGDYHGQFDEVLVKASGRAGAVASVPVAPGIPSEAVSNMVVLPYLAPESLAWIRNNAEDIAAVIVEPVQSRHPSVEPGPFLRELRAITEQSGTAFVFDEVITGFRVHPGGMQALLGIRADLATYGKVVGGGMPVGILAGTAQFMDALDGGQWSYGDASFPEVAPTFFAGTFVRHPLVLAAVHAVLLHVKEHGPALQETLSERSRLHVDRLNADFARRGLATTIERCSSWYYLDMAREDRLATLIFPYLRLHGVHILEGFPCFITTAHSDADLAHIERAFTRALDDLQDAGLLRPSMPVMSVTEESTPDVEAGLPAEVPLTEAQREVWLAAQLGDGASCAFNESVSLHLSGALDTAALAAALDGLVARHDAMRARIGRGGATMQVVQTLPLALPRTDLTSAPDPEAAMAELLDEDARTPFDMEAGPLVRARLIALGPDRHVLVLTAHHIICDGWSMNILTGDLCALYTAHRLGRSADLPAPLPFRRYALDLSSRDTGEVPEFWRKEFEVLPQPVDLPVDRAPVHPRSFRGATLTTWIDGDLTRAVKTAAAREGCTLFVALFAASQVVFGRLAGTQDVVMAIPSAAQNGLDDAILVGHCVNFLPLRAAFAAGEPFADHLKRVKHKVLSAFEQPDTTLGTLVRRLEIPRDLNRLPLTSIQFNLERLNDKLAFEGLEASFTSNPKAFVNFDLFLNIAETNDGLKIDCDYSTDLFDEATIARWIGHLRSVLSSVAEDPARRVEALPLLTKGEHRWLVEDLNRAPSVARDEATLDELVTLQAQRTPDAVAVACGDARWTYRQLADRADRIALAVGALAGAEPTRIGLAVERSPEMVAAMLGIMKAGHAYVPLDPAQPVARSRQVLAAAEAALLLCDRSSTAAIAEGGLPVLQLDQPLPDAPSVAAADPGRPDRAAYVIFTSGSTGTPKGVEVGHRSVVNLLRSMAVEPGFTAADTLLAVTTTTFDISVLELFLPLILGGRTVIADRDEVRGGFGLVDRIRTSGATVLQATPSLWRVLLEAGFQPGTDLKMLCGGEPLPQDLADLLLANGGELWNLYGPTETTIWSSAGRVGPGRVTIGGPVAGTQLYVLDRDDALAPIGVAGELYIGGVGLAHGYFNRPDLTAAAFREIAVPGRGPERLYRTGDLASRAADGTIRLLGRADQQIKLRGFRIDLEEIELVLRAYPGVVASAVALLQRGDSTSLVGYFTDASGTVTAAALAAHVAAKLPDYMVPTLWQRLDAMPMTANGKLDRKRLPEPEAGARRDARPVVPPRNPREAQIAAIWKDVLKVDDIGVEDNIFSLGADSLHIFRIAARLMDEKIDLEAKHVFENPTIAQLASAADASETRASRTVLPSLMSFRRGSTLNGVAR
ncbi:amino acid adenylation domain-containing protein [Methylobacterium sp. M6A4_1b]